VAKSGLAVDANSQKFVLANILTQLKDGVRYAPDQFFIDRLHKYATNQIADRVREEIRDATKKKLSEASQPSAVTQTVENSNVLEIAKV
jgi:methionine salvage enolase-phosphatase E1